MGQPVKLPSAVQQDHSLSNLVNQGIGVSRNPCQELGRLPFHQRRKLFCARPRTNQPTDELPVFPKSRTVLDKAHGLIPSNNLAAHHQYGSVGVNSRSFIEEVNGSIR